MDQAWREGIEAIRGDHTSGSAEITRRAARLAVRFLSERDTDWGGFLSFARALVRAQPEMASVWNLANDLLWAAEGPQGFRERKDRLARAAERKANEEIACSLAEHLAPLLEGRDQLVTVSSSSTLQGALAFLAGSGRQISVTCAESRPMFEGRMLAERLAAEGLRVRLASDAAVYGEVTGSCVVAVGVDAVRPSAITNKVGTWALALAARERGAPFYVVAERAKFLPGEVGRRVRSESPDELWPGAPPTVEVVNRYFEEVPIQLVDAVVTESGVLTAAEAGAVAGSVELFPGLWSTGGGL